MDFAALPSNARRWIVAVFGIAALATVAGASVLVLPTSLAYRLDPTSVTVEARLGVDWGREIPRAAITDTAEVTLDGGRRTNGTARPGFCVGKWSYPSLGPVWQATTCGPTGVRLRTADATYVLAPADAPAFLAALDTEGSSGTFDPAPGAPAGRFYAFLPALLLVPLVATGVLLSRVARTFHYTVADGVLTLPAHLRPVRVRLAGAKVTPGPASGLRVAGTALPGLYLGLFADKRGRYHAAATSRTDGVWIEGDRRVYVSPADLPGFLAAISSAGAAPGP